MKWNEIDYNTVSIFSKYKAEFDQLCTELLGKDHLSIIDC